MEEYNHLKLVFFFLGIFLGFVVGAVIEEYIIRKK